MLAWLGGFLLSRPASPAQPAASSPLLVDGGATFRNERWIRSHPANSTLLLSSAWEAHTLSARPSVAAFVGSSHGKRWCEGTCPMSAHKQLQRAIQGIDMSVPGQNNSHQLAWTGQYSKDRVELDPRQGTEPPPEGCTLCNGKPYLFVVSIGGRTGSTTVLNMLNAHPIIRLAGENNGMLKDTVTMYLKAAQGISVGFSGNAYSRGKLSPVGMLSKLQQYWDLAMKSAEDEPDPPATPIRGFKEITWDEDTLAMLDLLFPCHRKIFSVRNNESEHLESINSAFPGAHKSGGGPATVATALLKTFRDYAHALHLRDQLVAPWRSFWLPLEEFTKEKFSELYEWLGEYGCTWTDVLHSNEGEENMNVNAVTDARKMLHGKCTLRAVDM